MTATALLDHLILDVNELQASIGFYERVLGFRHTGQDGPFAVVRVNEGFTLLLARRATKGGVHLAFALSRSEFDAVFARLRDDGVGYGDAFDTVGSQHGPGIEDGARGPGKTLYFFDPNKHLLEIRHYEG